MLTLTRRVEQSIIALIIFKIIKNLLDFCGLKISLEIFKF